MSFIKRMGLVSFGVLLAGVSFAQAPLQTSTNSFMMLLNQPGVTASNTVGYADSGLNITLSDSALTGIHYSQTASYPNGGLTGTFAYDGSNVEAGKVNGIKARTALLGEDPNGQWTLFLADLDYGEQGQLGDWGLVVTAVPEPGTCGLLALGLAGMLGLRAWKRGRKQVASKTPR